MAPTQKEASNLALFGGAEGGVWILQIELISDVNEQPRLSD